MINLRTCNGRVPVPTLDPQRPIELVPFPSFEEFCSLYGKKVTDENLLKYWKILNCRADGSTLVTAAKLYGVTAGRVRQIEAKFIRLFGLRQRKQPS